MKNNNLVVYKNELNLVPMRKFNSVEMDLFFAICAKMREKKSEIVQFLYEDLKDLSDYKPTSTSRFIDDIESVYRKMLSLQFYQKDEKHRRGFVLFSDYEIDLENEIVKIRVNPNFEYILNQLSNEFTRFELEEFTTIRSSYAKTAYRQLKQYRTTGYKKFSMNEFKEIFCIPNSYKMSDLDKRVFSPIKDELTPYFEGLRITKVSAKKSRKIEFVEFKFKSESDFKDGKKVFRDNSGHYYEKDILELTKEEVDKAFPIAFPK